VLFCVFVVVDWTEILDVNDDGQPDLYVVQVDETPAVTNYCSPMSSITEFYDSGGPRAPDDFVPPLDTARDVLLVGNHNNAYDDGSPLPLFVRHDMEFAEPGCGSLVQTFGNGRTMILAQGSQDRSGHNLLLQW
jgi:hypothetical protein